VLLPQAAELDAVDKEYKLILTKKLIQDIVALIPDEWLMDEPEFDSVDAHRRAYCDFLETRVNHSEIFLNEAKHARESLI
jgi:hypothetical protein